MAGAGPIDADNHCYESLAAFTTHDLHEGMKAFMERREPQFTGR